MSTFRSSWVGHFTRGGQTTVHFIRMIWQVFENFTTATMAALGVLSLLVFMLTSEDQDRRTTASWAAAYVAVHGLKNSDASIPFIYEGKQTRVKAPRLLRHPAVISAVDRIYLQLITSFCYGIAGVVIFVVIGIRFIHNTGRRQAEDKFLRGGQVVSSSELIKKIKIDGPVGDVTVSGIPLPMGIEVANMLFVGAPGTGKSQNITELLRTVRRKRQRAIVYDIAGDFVQSFYREGKDIILNPFDQRCAFWNVWCETKHAWDYDQIAASLIPNKTSAGGDPFWTLGARLVFAELVRKIGTDEVPSNDKLIHAILNITIEEIIRYVEQTDATAVISEGGEKMAISIRGVLATYARSLKYLPTGGVRFSIREWVSVEDDDSWVFVTTKEDQKEALKPLISVWIDTAASAILSLSRNRDRRIWMFVDELPTLNKLPSLLNTLTNSRKYGGCNVLGFQNYPQMCSTYGKEEADAIAEACSTWAVYRANASVTAEWASKGMGMTEFVETTENISYGVNDIRDGVSLSGDRRERAIVLPTEILNLPDMHGYLRLGRGYPVGKFKMQYRSIENIAPDFIPRSTAATDFRQGAARNFDFGIPDTENQAPASQPPVERIAYSDGDLI